MIYHTIMSHVSRRKLKKKVFVKIGDELSGIITKANSSNDINWLFKELITPTERIMLAKRLAIFLMLEKKYSYRAIERTLKVTQQTIVRFWKKTKEPGYKPLLRKIESNKGGKGFLQDLEKMILMGMPPRGRQWMMMRRAYNKLK